MSAQIRYIQRPERNTSILTFALACQAVFIMAMAVVSMPVHAEPQEQACPKLLMDFECAQYYQQIELAHGEVQRCRIVQEYVAILEDRRRACHCADTLEQQEAQLRAALRH